MVASRKAEALIRNAMTCDVEDYFQVQAFEDVIARDAWNHLPSRVEGNTNRVLDLFAQANIKATFFTLGWVAERFPALVRRIIAEGHELASHGMDHVRANHQDRMTFRTDVSDTKALLEDIGGVPVQGYRAASFSIGEQNLWALEVLAEIGYRYSSSIYPIKHDLYGMPSAPRFAFHPFPGSQFTEIPVTTVELFGKRLPCGGGGYFRLLPYALSRAAMRRINAEGGACMFYFHPWEIDPDQPRQTQAPLKSRFRHYTNLRHMEAKLSRVLQDFSWGRVDDVFLKVA